MNIKYRPEIDGMRALAVIAVIINHISKEILPSGYLGVDVFFVISGYVITLSLHARKSNSITELLLEFYTRRFKRLIPALLLFVIMMSILISLFNPSTATTLNTGVASLFGFSNLYLIKQANDYFSDSAQLNAFTHTWSLGVEEQFYILFPFIIWLTGFGINKKHGDKLFFGVLALLSLISLIGFSYLSNTKHYFAYYFMPTRFWELAAGAFMLIITNNIKTDKNKTLISGLSLFSFIALAAVFFAAEKYAIYTTISTVVLTLLLIFSVQPETTGYKIFACKPMVYIGLISYSLYLWHWGVLSISRWSIGIHWWTVPIQVALMFLLAIGSYHYIENPFRKISWSQFRWVTIGYGVTALVAGSALLLLLIKPINGLLYTGKQPKLIATGVVSLTHEYSIPNGLSIWRWGGEKCVLSNNSQILINDCTLGDFEKSKTRILVLGNSFSTAFVQAFDQLVLEDNYSVTLTSSWGASPVKEIINNSPWAKANDYYWASVVPELLSKLQAGDWVFLVNDMAEFSPKTVSTDGKAKLDLLKLGLENLSRELSKREIKLAILHGIPFAREASCEPAAAVKQWFSPFGGQCSFITREETLKRRTNLDQTLTSLAKQNKITVVDLFDIFCPETVCSYQAKNGEVLYRDVFSHPSVEAARLTSPIIRKALNP